MKIYYVVCAIIIYSLSASCQELHLFGPRAGIGYLSDQGDGNLKKGIHSAFGWQIELPYTGKDITGYGEAGVMLLGIEQGVVFPHIWGYFGIRLKNIGVGIGPAINPIGVGLGLNPYYQIDLETIRIPIGIDMNFIKKTSRFQLFIGFNYK